MDGTVARRIARTAVLSVALAGLALAAVRVAVSVSMRNEPTVDLRARNGQSRPAPDPTGDAGGLRFAVATRVSAEATFTTYRRLVQRICRDVGRREVFVLRPSYADVRRELEQGRIDVAFVGTGTYVHARPRGRIRLLARPEFEGGLQYRCLFIVPAGSGRDSPEDLGRSRSAAERLRSSQEELDRSGATRPSRGAVLIEDLRGAVMAFTDPESNTGHLVPQALLLERGYDPKSFFDKIVFTGGHDRSIRSVALSLVDVAAVDSLVWESNTGQDASLARRARVIWRSEAFGPPPIVVPAGLDSGLESSLRQAFLTLDQDEGGREILSSIGIKRFVKAHDEDYASVIALYRRCQAHRAASGSADKDVMSAPLECPPVSRGDLALPARGESGATSSPVHSNVRRGRAASGSADKATRRGRAASGSADKATRRGRDKP